MREGQRILELTADIHENFKVLSCFVWTKSEANLEYQDVDKRRSCCSGSVYFQVIPDCTAPSCGPLGSGIVGKNLGGEFVLCPDIFSDILRGTHEVL